MKTTQPIDPAVLERVKNLQKEASQVLDTFSGGDDAPLIARQAATIADLSSAISRLTTEIARQALSTLTKEPDHG
jgi:PP-loop superfamily ATP-utilizing enzyme